MLPRQHLNLVRSPAAKIHFRAGSLPSVNTEFMKVALVHDYLNQFGGAERVLQSLTEIFPEAPIFTLLYNKKRTGNIFGDKKIQTSFLQKIPLAKNHHRLFLYFMPQAIEQFDLSEFDLVISDSASFAKGILTSSKTLHLCYCYTPTRYLWDDHLKYLKESTYPWLVKKIIPRLTSYLRLWDFQAAQRPDKLAAVSDFIAKRARKYYRRDACVIYPPVRTKFFIPSQKKNSDYFLMVGRLLHYKRFDLGIGVFNQLGLPLKIAGSGPEKKHLQKTARANIEFVGSVSDEDLKNYYQGARALIFPQEEDFGIVAVEAMSCGVPVIAYQSGGALETVREGVSGIFFKEQTIAALAETVKNFNKKKFNSSKIRERALQFDKTIFKKKFKEFIDKAWQEHKS